MRLAVVDDPERVASESPNSRLYLRWILFYKIREQRAKSNSKSEQDLEVLKESGREFFSSAPQPLRTAQSAWCGLCWI